MNSDTYTYLSLSIIFFLINSIVFYYKRNELVAFTSFLSVAFIACVYIIDKIKNYIYYYLLIVISALLSLMFIIYYFNLAKQVNMRTSVQIQLFMLYFLSVVTFILLTRSVAFLKSSNENQPLRGPKGPEGYEGVQGGLAAFDQEDFAFNTMKREANIAIELYLDKSKKYESIKDTDYIKDHLQNLYFINNLKKISKSTNIKDIDIELLDDVLSNVKENVRDWVNHILNYSQGYNFLTDKFQIEKSWSELLSKRKSLNETESPFELIKTHEIWNW